MQSCAGAEDSCAPFGKAGSKMKGRHYISVEPYAHCTLYCCGKLSATMLSKQRKTTCKADSTPVGQLFRKKKPNNLTLKSSYSLEGRIMCGFLLYLFLCFNVQQFGANFITGIKKDFHFGEKMVLRLLI